MSKILKIYIFDFMSWFCTKNDIANLVGLRTINRSWSVLMFKQCRRHNGPKGRVHITSSNTKLDKISSSESQPSINFKILTKTSFRISTKIQLGFDITSTKHQQKKLTKLHFKSCLNFNFKILTKPCAQSLNKSLAF